MNTLFVNRRDLNLKFYKEQIFSSVHIGDFVLIENQNEALQDLPKICVVMPVYNTKPSYIKQAMESVTVKQTYAGPIHLIIVDDGSTDARVVKYLDQFTRQTNDPITVMRLP